MKSGNMLARGVVVLLLTGYVNRTDGAEYFVGKQGRDTNDGLTRSASFLTIQRGVDALSEGDILTIGPGEYLEAVSRADLGGTNRQTVIRASIPGTVLLRGDVPSVPFSKVDGYRFVYAGEFAGSPQAIKEIETLRILEKKPNIADLEFEPGSFHYDADHRKLYISTSDLQPPERHHYSICVTEESGLLLDKPVNVVVEGLAATGYYRAGLQGQRHGRDYAWGIVLCAPLNCMIRDCTAYLNAGGICIDRGKGNVIEGCTTYGNASSYQIDAAAIIAYAPRHDEIRDCTSFLNRQKGIEFYLGSGVQSRLLNNLAWGNRSINIQMKGGDIYQAERCVGLGSWHAEVRFHYLTHCLIGSIPEPLEQYMDRREGNIVLAKERGLDLNNEFADPVQHDYRLQATSRFRSTTPNGMDLGPHPYKATVFYVKADGNDENDGLSVQHAWKTVSRAISGLKSGDTLYIEGGTYSEALNLTAGQPKDDTIHLRGRGREPVLLQGALNISGSARLKFERLCLAGPLHVEKSRQIAFDNCVFQSEESALTGLDAEGLTLTHCLFTRDGPKLEQCSDIFMSGNIFNAPVRIARSGIAYSDYNSYAAAQHCWTLDGAALSFAPLQEKHDRYSRIASAEIDVKNGIARIRNAGDFAIGGPMETGLGRFSFVELTKPELNLVGPFAHSLTETTANIEWWTSAPATATIVWGETPACKNTNNVDCGNFGSFSLSGLAPGTKYYFSIQAVRPLDHLNQMGIDAMNPESADLAFVTETEPHVPRTFHVAPDGNDANSGLARDCAWQTVNRAAAELLAGDTVRIAGGVYKEMVRVRATGDRAKPITFRSVPGERVVFDGDDRSLPSAFVVCAKNFIHLDGLFFQKHGKGSGTQWFRQELGVITLYQSDHLRITRCLMDGRWTSYSSTFVSSANVSNLLIRNCVITTGFSNMKFGGGTDLQVENNVFIRPMIFQFTLSGGPAHFSRNIFTDSIPGKENVPLFEMGHAQYFHLKDNCFYLRRHPETERREKVFRFFGDEEFGDSPLKRKATIAQYDKKMGSSDTIFADPGFAGARDITVTDKSGEKAYYTVDQFMKSAHLRVEPEDELEFSHFFATNPELIKRDIGLQPEVFEEFHSH